MELSIFRPRTLALVALMVVSAACNAEGSPPSPTLEEEILLAGMRLDAAVGCAPVRSDLPGSAVAGIACTPPIDGVDTVSLFLFDTRPGMLEAYLGRLKDHGVAPQTGDCVNGAGEYGYVSGDEPVELGDFRQGCWTDAGGFTWMAFEGDYVLAAVHGQPADIDSFLQWPWLGNRDQPGGPTLWSPNGPVSTEK
jgi:hypothetical protein